MSDAPRGPLPAVLALNNRHALETSRLGADRLETMWRSAFMAETIGTCDAFLIAFAEDAAYDSPNFLWFRERHARFVYVDRIVTAPEARGRGLARRLYERLFAAARASGRSVVACEINTNPPNPASDAFHARLGFGEVGRVARGEKAVRFLVRTLSDAPPSAASAR